MNRTDCIKMPRNRISPYKTTVIEGYGTGMVKYHSTVIVEWTDQKIILRSGGWETVTTKRKMNQAARQFLLGFTVFQKDFVWFVTLPNGQTVEFADGMTIKRNLPSRVK
jgi:hypothetical protein